ncbi:MAG: DUF2194 domain-containing protein [Lachnospiraceae bacterium]|nr:DUF2194 domain-containing protein [Lachnospiraceae bacterium]
MVSRRNFFSIFIMMAALLFMFQFSQVFKESGNDYNVNQHVKAIVPDASGSWQDAGLDLNSSELKENDYIVFIGDTEKETGRIVTQWCTYSKRNLVVLDSTDEYELGMAVAPEMIVLDSAQLNYQNELGKIMKMGEEKVPMVFCGLPHASVVYRQTRLQELLGIEEVRQEEVAIDGVYLFPDFLLGGEALYQVMQEEDEERQDLELTVPWYVTDAGTKTYVTGVMDADEVEREEFPAIIWRNTYEGTMIFTVSGDYMSDLTGLGILDAIAYEIKPFEIYPVVNAQNVMLVDYPGFASENEERLMQIYSRDARAVLRDVMWPSISALAERNKLKLTCYFSPQYDYADDREPVSKDVTFYLQQLNEIDAEAGKSLTYTGDITLAQKNEKDNAFYADAVDGYRFTAAYAGEELPKDLKAALTQKEMADIRTVASVYQEEIPLLSYYTEDVTLQCATGTSKEYTYSMDLKSRALMTSLAYSNVLIDMHSVMWPETVEDQWEHYFDNASSNISTYWTGFSTFDRTTLTESDERVRALLNLDYVIRENGNTVFMQISGAEEAWFILRTHGEEISSITGGEYEKIEKNAYLIHTQASGVTFTLRPAEEVLQYGER